MENTDDVKHVMFIHFVKFDMTNLLKFKDFNKQFMYNYPLRIFIAQTLSHFC